MKQATDRDVRDRWRRIRHAAVYVAVALVTATIVQVLAVMGR